MKDWIDPKQIFLHPLTRVDLKSVHDRWFSMAIYAGMGATGYGYETEPYTAESEF